MATAKVSPKLKTATAGAAGGAGVFGTFLLWLTGWLVFDGSSDAAHVEETMAAVPYPVTGLILLIVAGAVAYVSGYYKPDDRSLEKGQRPTDAE